MKRGRRGASALVLAVSIGVVLSFVAIVVDLGLARLAQAQLQATTDAAALGGARRLDGSATGLTAARQTAVEVGGANEVMGVALALDANEGNAADGGVVLGVWDPDTDDFTPSTEAEEVNAVLVRARRQDLPVWFAVFLGRDRLAASALSLARRGSELGAGKVPYYLPFALPDCQVHEHDPDEMSDITFTLSPAGEDNVGWGAVDATPSAAWAKDHINAMLECMHAWDETGTVPEACSSAAAGESVNLDNGVVGGALSELNQAMAKGIDWNETVWGPLPAQHKDSTVPKAVYGTVLEGPIPIFDAGPEYCSDDAAWNETLPLLGFVWGVIYDVRTKGSASQKNVWVRVDMEHLHPVGDWYGGGSWGVTYSGPPVLQW